MQNVLVLPRESIHGMDGYMPWSHVGDLLESVTGRLTWMPRADAECSREWVQPIPCAIFRDSSGQYCVFRQARKPRSDLSHKVSFIVGGHIDRSGEGESVSDILEETVKREVSEEVGVDLDSPLEPVGMVIDSSSITASRHIGFIYDCLVDRDIRSQAVEEFSVGSKYNGEFFSIESLSRFRSKFDPWSFILFSQYLGGGFSRDIGRQPMLSIPTE